MRALPASRAARPTSASANRKSSFWSSKTFQRKPTPGRVAFSGDPDEFRLTLVEHLEELRDRIIRVLGVLTMSWIAGWFLVMPVYRYVEGRIDRAIVAVLKDPALYKPVIHQTTEAFMLKFKLSFYIALIVSLPYIVVQIWGFVAPALKESEQRPFKRLAPVSVALFLLGAGFAWAIVPSAFAWFASYVEEFPGVAINQEAGSQVFFVAKMLLAFGVAFQLPLIVYGVGMAGLLTADTLLKYWRHGATGIFVLSMLITPSQDPVSMLMMAIPLTILFIGSVYAVKFMERKRVRPEAEDDAPLAVLDMGEPIAVPEATQDDRVTLE